MRLFFGLPLAGAALDIAREAQRRLGESRAKMSWADAARLHVTLAFLGEHDEKGALLAAEAGRIAASAARPFELTLDAAGAFPSPRRPRVIWIGGRSDELVALATHLQSELRARGFDIEERRFRVHATLARVPPQSARAAAEALAALGALRPGAMRVESFALFVSQLRGARGAVHTARDTFRLGA